MFCKYCGKELKEDAFFCQYCGEDQRVVKDAKQKVFTDGVNRTVFLILTLLLTLYLPVHLAGAHNFLTPLLSIPTMILCVGCWVVFAASDRNETSVKALAVICGGLYAQITVFFAEGLAVAAASFLRFGRFLNDIRPLLEQIDMLMRLVLVVLAACLLLVICGLILLFCLRRIAQFVRSEKHRLAGSKSRQNNRFSIPKVTRTVVAAAVCTVFQVVFASPIHFLYELLLSPRLAIAEGAFSGLFGLSAGGWFTDLLNRIMSAYGVQGDNAWGGLKLLKDAFLRSQEANEMQTFAAVLFLAVLACVVILLVKIRKQSSQTQ